MILRVNPNRMELIRLRKRFALARRGHKLLQDKLEQMMRMFLGLLKEIGNAKDEFNARMQDILGDLLYCRIITSRDNFLQIISCIDAKTVFSSDAMRIMNVKAPVFKVKELTIAKHYNLFKTPAQMDMVVLKADGYIRSLVKLAQLLKTADILSYEIERTRRRVNALEYILIPSIQETIRYIDHKLSELERTSLVRLMRIKACLPAGREIL